MEEVASPIVFDKDGKARLDTKALDEFNNKYQLPPVEEVNSLIFSGKLNEILQQRYEGMRNIMGKAIQKHETELIQFAEKYEENPQKFAEEVVKILAKEFGMEGFEPPIEFIKMIDGDSASGLMNYFAGKIQINKNVTNAKELVEIISHEFIHELQFRNLITQYGVEGIREIVMKDSSISESDKASFIDDMLHNSYNQRLIEHASAFKAAPNGSIDYYLGEEYKHNFTNTKSSGEEYLNQTTELEAYYVGTGGSTEEVNGLAKYVVQEPVQNPRRGAGHYTINDDGSVTWVPDRTQNKQNNPQTPNTQKGLLGFAPRAQKPKNQQVSSDNNQAGNVSNSPQEIVDITTKRTPDNTDEYVSKVMDLYRQNKTPAMIAKELETDIFEVKEILRKLSSGDLPPEEIQNDLANLYLKFEDEKGPTAPDKTFIEFLAFVYDNKFNTPESIRTLRGFYNIVNKFLQGKITLEQAHNSSSFKKMQEFKKLTEFQQREVEENNATIAKLNQISISLMNEGKYEHQHILFKYIGENATPEDLSIAGKALKYAKNTFDDSYDSDKIVKYLKCATHCTETFEKVKNGSADKNLVKFAETIEAAFIQKGQDYLTASKMLELYENTSDTFKPILASLVKSRDEINPEKLQTTIEDFCTKERKWDIDNASPIDFTDDGHAQAATVLITSKAKQELWQDYCGKDWEIFDELIDNFYAAATHRTTPDGSAGIKPLSKNTPKDFTQKYELIELKITGNTARGGTLRMLMPKNYSLSKEESKLGSNIIYIFDKVSRHMGNK